MTQILSLTVIAAGSFIGFLAICVGLLVMSGADPQAQGPDRRRSPGAPV